MNYFRGNYSTGKSGSWISRHWEVPVAVALVAGLGFACYQGLRRDDSCADLHQREVIQPVARSVLGMDRLREGDYVVDGSRGVVGRKK